MVTMLKFNFHFAKLSIFLSFELSTLGSEGLKGRAEWGYVVIGPLITSALK